MSSSIKSRIRKVYVDDAGIEHGTELQALEANRALRLKRHKEMLAAVLPRHRGLDLECQTKFNAPQSHGAEQARTEIISEMAENPERFIEVLKRIKADIDTDQA